MEYMNKTITHKHWIYMLLIPFWGIIAGACSENIEPYEPGDGQGAYVNFYHAMEAIRQGAAADSLYRDNMIYINDSIKGSMFNRVSSPRFEYSPQDDVSQYPLTITGSPYVNDYVSNWYMDRRVDVYWLPLMAGDYRFIFTSRDKTFLKEDVVPLAPKSLNTLYITESPETEDAYAIVNVPVEVTGVPGKTKVNVVNLSPDLGKISVSWVGAGNETSLMGENIGFGQYTRFAELDTADAAAGVFHIQVGKQGGGTLRSHSLPASPGGVYTVVLQGFSESAERRIKKSNDAYSTVNVSPNLRLTQRRLYWEGQ